MMNWLRSVGLWLELRKGGLQRNLRGDLGVGRWRNRFIRDILDSLLNHGLNS